MKLILKEGKRKYHTKWSMPSFSEEKEEFERYSFSEEEMQKIKSKFNIHNIVDLDKSIWKKLQNTDSWMTSDVEDAIRYSKEYEKDYESIIKAYESGSVLPCPIILKSRGKYELIAGNTRLMFARAFGIIPKVLIIKL